MRFKKGKLGRAYVWLASLFLLFNIAIASISLSWDDSYESISLNVLGGFIGYFDKTLDLPGVNEGSWFGSSKRTLRSVLRVIPKTIAGEFPARIDHLRIDLKYKHLEKMKKEREAALAKGILLNPKFYPASIVFNGTEYAAKIRLKGDRSDHWRGGDRWSFRVRVKNGGGVFGMTQFSLQNPVSRAIPHDMLFQEWLREMGNLAPRHEFTRVTFNGDYWGVMNVEEHMSRNFLEMSGRNDGPIFKYPEEETWAYNDFNQDLGHGVRFWGGSFPTLFNKSRRSSDAQHVALFSYGVLALRRLQKSDVQAEDILDLDAFSRLFIATTVFGSFHAVSPANMRLYLNPNTLKIEPVATDQKPQGTINRRVEDRMPTGQLFGNMLQSPVFFENYKKNYQAALLAAPAIERKYKKICAIFPLDCPDFRFGRFNRNLATLEGKEDKIRDLITRLEEERRSTQSDELPASRRTEISPPIVFIRQVHAEYFTSGKLVVWNLMSDDVFLERVTLVCSLKIDCSDSFDINNRVRIAASKVRFRLNRAEIRVPQNLILGKDRYIEIMTRSDNQTRKTQLKISLQTNGRNPFLLARAENENLSTRPYINVAGTDLTVPTGHWQIDAPLVVPRGYRLRIEPGTSLAFGPNAYVLSHGEIIVRGTAARPVHLGASDRQYKWPGIYVSEAPEPSEFAHVKISNTRAFQAELLNLTGGVTFYKSDVVMTHVTFAGSSAEDALNIVGSKFQIDETTFRETVSDGLDSDFSNGEITKTVFDQIGGDGLDLAMSRVVGNKLEFSQIFDKAISAGEQSTARLSDIRVTKAGVAVVSKDGSKVTVQGLAASGLALSTGMTYVKKPRYGVASLSISGTESRLGSFINQKGNSLTVNGHDVAARDWDVNALYASGRMLKIK